MEVLPDEAGYEGVFVTGIHGDCCWVSIGDYRYVLQKVS